jgi:hypothetical protein
MVSCPAGEFVQDVLDGADGGCRPGSPFARRRPGGAGERLADHAAVNLVTGGEPADGHAAGGVVADDAEQPCLALCLGFRGRRGPQVAASGGGEAGEGEGERGAGAAADCGEPPQPDRPVGDVGVADVDLEQARAQVVGARARRRM